MKVAILRNSSVAQWAEAFRAAGYEANRWPPYTWRDLPETTVKDMSNQGMPISLATDGMPESGRVGSNTTPNPVESEEEKFNRLVQQYATEERVLCAWKNKNVFMCGDRQVELDAAGYSPRWESTEVREIPVSLYRLLTANEAEGFTTKPDEIEALQAMNQRRFSEPERLAREQREAARKAKEAERLQLYSEKRASFLAREKAQKKLGLTDAEFDALLPG